MSASIDDSSATSPLSRDQLRSFLISALSTDPDPSKRTTNDCFLFLSPDQLLRDKDKLRVLFTSRRFRFLYDVRFEVDGSWKDVALCEYNPRTGVRGRAVARVTPAEVTVNGDLWSLFLGRVSEVIYQDVRFPPPETRIRFLEFERSEFYEGDMEDTSTEA